MVSKPEATTATIQSQQYILSSDANNEEEDNKDGYGHPEIILDTDEGSMV